MRKLRALTPPPEPRWETIVAAGDGLPAVEVLFAPIGDRARQLAGRASAKVRAAAPPEIRDELAQAIGNDGKLIGVLSNEALELLEEMGAASSREMIRVGILDWKGLGGPADDEDDDTVVSVTAETIAWFLADDELRRAADRAYVLPDALRIAEKNASAAASTGTGAVATRDSGTAISPATPPKTGDVKRIPIAASPGARTSKKSPRPTKA